MSNDSPINNRTAEALLARRALAEKATPGPWEKDDIDNVFRKPTKTSEEYQAVVLLGQQEGIYHPTKANAAHIAANSPDVVMADIDEILRLRAEVERLEKEADWLTSEKIVQKWNGRFVGAPYKDNRGYAVYETQAEAVASWRAAARQGAEEENHGCLL